MNKIPCLILLLLLFKTTISQELHRRTEASPITDGIRIDGILDEASWGKAQVAGDFRQRMPYNLQPAALKTEVSFLYDNTGLYIGAKMYDPHPDSIPAQMGIRDAGGLNADYFMVILSPFNDGINAFCFLVYVSDVQADFKIPGADGEDDFSWDAVWQSKVQRNQDGWVAEMKIPYSAIRFPGQEVQQWGINCQRLIRRTREVDTWNPVDNKIAGYVNQMGTLENIKNIKPPLRLSVTPYMSGYLQNNTENKNYTFSGNYGADLKYGINQSFTLDMTLIPDFGQVQSDDKIYNFSPFEIRYDEKRQFFTEGTELFNKGGIFYSRRVGSTPKGYYSVDSQIEENEIITSNPQTTQLINATKISGRTTKGLGIGLFNGMSANTYATALNTTTGESRKILTQGFTNYNTLVLDQNLKNNSYLDFLNTNYYIPREGYMANVTGTAFMFADKSYTYFISGEGFVSQKYFREGTNEFGLRSQVSLGKMSGKFLYDYTMSMETESYDPNDMGFNARNNFFNNSVSLQYNLTDPFGKFLSCFNYFSVNYNSLYTGLKFTDFNLDGSTHFTTLKHFDFGGNVEWQPVPSHDYYEPRVDGWMYISPAYGTLSGWISTDYRKKFAIDVSLSGSVSSFNHASAMEMMFSPRYRLSDRILLIYRLNQERIWNDVGYVSDSVSDGLHRIIFGRRDINTLSHVLEASYILRGNMSLSLRGRYYWVNAPYYSFYTLQEDGTLKPNDYNGDPDVNYNLFNLDFSYTWNFAPGSQVSLMWKNMINTQNSDTSGDFFSNFGHSFESPSANSFSIRILYYLDALYFAKK